MDTNELNGMNNSIAIQDLLFFEPPPMDKCRLILVSFLHFRNKTLQIKQGTYRTFLVCPSDRSSMSSKLCALNI